MIANAKLIKNNPFSDILRKSTGVINIYQNKDHKYHMVHPKEYNDTPS